MRSTDKVQCHTGSLSKNVPVCRNYADNMLQLVLPKQRRAGDG